MSHFKPEFESRLLADRWAKNPNYGSPITAWTVEMLKAYREAEAASKVTSDTRGNTTEESK